MAIPPVDEDGNEIAREVDEEAESLNSECLVLLQMLCDFKPGLSDELGITSKLKTAGANVASIEVVWRGELQRRFFRIPDICQDLAVSSKANLVEEVDRSNLENKLLNLLERSHDLYREIKYQQVLKEMKISTVFSLTNQNRATWFAFFISCLVNLLYLIFYEHDAEGNISKPAPVTAVIDALNVIQSVSAAFTLLLFLIVRIPVKYQALREEFSPLLSAFYTSTDAMTIYYIVYLLICLFSLLLADYWMPFLLLDIVVKNSTCRNVLNSVMLPRKQLGMTLVLGIFVTYIYAYLYFTYFMRDINHDFHDIPEPMNNLFTFFITSWCWGLRSGGGFGDIFKHNLKARWLLDLSFFLVVNVVMLNIIFGIIIDTFSELRRRKVERTEDILGKCFICGIDKETFDRALDGTEGFNNHIKKGSGDHHMWHYFYFIVFIWEQDKDDDDGLEWFYLFYFSRYYFTCTSFNFTSLHFTITH